MLYDSKSGPLPATHSGVTRPLEGARGRYLMMGLGRQSMTLWALAERGMIGPRPDGMVCADVGRGEREWARDNLAFLQSPNSPRTIPLHVVSRGDIDADFAATLAGERKRFPNPPLFTKGPDGKRGRITRGCTRDYKINGEVAELKRLLGYKKGARMPREPIVEQWLGFTTDELVDRAMAPPAPWIHNRYPLVEIGWTTEQCVSWFKSEFGFEPRQSGCLFCPFTSDAVWQRMKTENPAEFERACDRDEAARHNMPNLRDPAYLHDSLEPIRTIDFAARIKARQGALLDWNPDHSRCPEGACGV